MFPSPCGEKVGINAMFEAKFGEQNHQVSVPLRGKGRDQLADKVPEWILSKLFPSPCGEKVGINKGAHPSKGLVFLAQTFPSPCGEKVGINASQSNGFRVYLPWSVSVPLRGKGRDQRA